MKRGSLLFALMLAGCASAPRKVLTSPVLPEGLTERGSTVYFGSSFALKGAPSEPSFVYERRVESSGGAMFSTHITREPSGAIALIEGAAHSEDYALTDYTLFVNQLGQTGSLHVEGDTATFRIDGERTKTEQLSGPIVVGPTLVGFVFKRLEALRAKQRVGVRFAVLERLETIGFDLELVEALAPDQTRIRMSPSGFLYRLAVAPLFLTFETATGKLVRLEGRIPPKLRDGERWADFDARVEYRFVADAYR